MKWIREASTVSRGWKTAIDLKEPVGLTNDAEDNDYERTKGAAQKVHEILERWRHSDVPHHFQIDTDELENISDEFHTMGYVDEEPTTSYFDSLMNALYDWADEERVLIR